MNNGNDDHNETDGFEAYADGEADLIELVGEDGETLTMEYITTIEYEGRDFLILAPLDETDSDEIEVAILEMKQDESGESFEPVDDEETLNSVFVLFQEMCESFTDPM